MTEIQLLFFASGIFYDIDAVVLPDIYLNPLAGLLREYLGVLWDNAWPDGMYLSGVLCFSLLFLTVAVGLILRLDKTYPKKCQI